VVVNQRLAVPGKAVSNNEGSLKMLATYASVVSAIVAAAGLFFSAYTVRNASIDQAHRTSTTLLQEYYAMKKKNDPPKIETPFNDKLDAFHVLFLAESIFVMNKVTEKNSAWMNTVQFLVRDVLVICEDEIPWDTYDKGFRSLVRDIYDQNVDNAGNTPRRDCA
jgi:hypothetical protein